MEENIYKEALDLLNVLELDSQRQMACNCGINIINILKAEITSFQKGDYEIMSQYPGEHYFIDCFFAKTKDDKKLERLFEKIYKNAREKKRLEK